MPKILFILKHREQPWGHSGYHLSSGLRNSVKFVVEMLHLLGIDAKMVEVIDNNHIDREVSKHKPTHVIVEAFWVVPEKFDVLMKLHPDVTWMVRDHSETPFISNEGIFADWTAGYLARGVEIACNSPRALTDMQAIGLAFGHPDLIGYLPNYYPVHVAMDATRFVPKPPTAGDTIKIGCFGAIRPLKNHLVQAVAALRYAYARGKKLEFHVNSTRVEGGANPILNNLRGLFANAHRATLVESKWLEHEEFLELLRDMDVCLQVSFSETFNIVSADAVNMSIPVIASKEVPWLGPYAWADPNSSTDVFNQMMAVQRGDRRDRLVQQWRDLSTYCAATQHVWWERFGFGHPPASLQMPVQVGISSSAVTVRATTLDAARKPPKPQKPHGKPHHHHHHHPHPYYGEV